MRRQSCYHIETSQLICKANQLTGFYMMETLAFDELIEWLSENKSLSNAATEDFLTFIQTVPYGGNIHESYVKTRKSIYDNQKTKFHDTTSWSRLYYSGYSYLSITSVIITFTAF